MNPYQLSHNAAYVARPQEASHYSTHNLPAVERSYDPLGASATCSQESPSPLPLDGAGSSSALPAPLPYHPLNSGLTTVPVSVVATQQAVTPTKSTPGKSPVARDCPPYNPVAGQYGAPSSTQPNDVHPAPPNESAGAHPPRASTTISSTGEPARMMTYNPVQNLLQACANAQDRTTPLLPAPISSGAAPTTAFSPLLPMQSAGAAAPARLTPSPIVLARNSHESQAGQTAHGPPPPRASTQPAAPVPFLVPVPVPVPVAQPRHHAAVAPHPAPVWPVNVIRPAVGLAPGPPAAVLAAPPPALAPVGPPPAPYFPAGTDAEPLRAAASEPAAEPQNMTGAEPQLQPQLQPQPQPQLQPQQQAEAHPYLPDQASIIAFVSEMVRRRDLAAARQPPPPAPQAAAAAAQAGRPAAPHVHAHAHACAPGTGQQGTGAGGAIATQGADPLGLFQPQPQTQIQPQPPAQFHPVQAQLCPQLQLQRQPEPQPQPLPVEELQLQPAEELQPQATDSDVLQSQVEFLQDMVGGRADVATCRDVLAEVQGDMDRASTAILELYGGGGRAASGASHGAGQNDGLSSPGAEVSVNFGQSPFVFDIEPYKVMSPPSALSSPRMGRSVAVEGKYTVRYIDNKIFGKVGTVQADFPAPPSSLLYYFEMKIQDAGRNTRIGLGYAHSGHPETHHVGAVEGSFALHGNSGTTHWEKAQGDDYGFKFGTGDVVGAALDFQRMQIFFTKNGRPGKALPVNFKRPLYPTVSLDSLGAKVSVNFGQSPFVFDIEPYKIKEGSRVAIRNVSIDDARSIQANRGGWDPSMETMLGTTGTVVEVLGNGDALVLLDHGGRTRRWSPVLLVPAGTPMAAVQADVSAPPSSEAAAPPIAEEECFLAAAVEHAPQQLSDVVTSGEAGGSCWPGPGAADSGLGLLAAAEDGAGAAWAESGGGADADPWAAVDGFCEGGAEAGAADGALQGPELAPRDSACGGELGWDAMAVEDWEAWQAAEAIEAVEDKMEELRIYFPHLDEDTLRNHLKMLDGNVQEALKLLSEYHEEEIYRRIRMDRQAEEDAALARLLAEQQQQQHANGVSAASALADSMADDYVMNALEELEPEVRRMAMTSSHDGGAALRPGTGTGLLSYRERRGLERLVHVFGGDVDKELLAEVLRNQDGDFTAARAALLSMGLIERQPPPQQQQQQQPEASLGGAGTLPEWDTEDGCLVSTRLGRPSPPRQRPAPPVLATCGSTSRSSAAQGHPTAFPQQQPQQLLSGAAANGLDGLAAASAGVGRYGRQLGAEMDAAAAAAGPSAGMAAAADAAADGSAAGPSGYGGPQLGPIRLLASLGVDFQAMGLSEEALQCIRVAFDNSPLRRLAQLRGPNLTVPSEMGDLLERQRAGAGRPGFGLTHTEKQALWDAHRELPLALKAMKEVLRKGAQAAYESEQPGSKRLAKELRTAASALDPVIHEQHSKASSRIYAQINGALRQQWVTDLHGLLPAEVPARLEMTLRMLLGSGGMVDWRIVTGKGLHSRGDGPKLLPLVEEWLIAHGLGFLQQPGSLVVQLTPEAAAAAGALRGAGAAASEANGPVQRQA
ncbi:hypothetical protein PLESTF_000858200 [Pleodorina starrii]|nr:hypothetical protein PLESTF_000858200 [Pleodorina starrii]